MQLSPLTAQTPFASLAPLVEAHRDGLKQAASDPSIWAHWAFDVRANGFDAWFDLMLARQASGDWVPHTVFDGEGKTVGQTCYLCLRPEHDGVEVGGTWYAPQVQATRLNPACKLMMIGHAFACGAQRVELKTDGNNARSRAAISKLGAQFEGIFRRHMRRPDGTWRDTAWYSIIAPEWPVVKAGLEARLGWSAS